MDAPKTVTANFNLLTTIASTTPVQVTVTGADARPARTPRLRRLPGARAQACSVSFGATQVSGSGDMRWVFTQWADGSTANPRTLTATAGATFTLRFGDQYKLTRSVTGQEA